MLGIIFQLRETPVGVFQGVSEKPVALKPFQKYLKIIILSKYFPNSDLGQ